MFGGSVNQAGAAPGVAVSEEQLLAAAKAPDSSTTSSVGEVDAGCPRFILAPRDNYITFYQNGHVGDAQFVTQRGEITKTARECQAEPGRIIIRYGFSGRVLLGPKGQPGTFTLPVNVAVNDATRTRVATDSLKVNVAVEPDKPIGYFSAVRTVEFPIPEGARPGEFELVVGFDNKAPGAG